METKITIESFIIYLPLIHASYNFLMLMLFCCQGFLGLKIKIQKSKKILPVNAIKIHRKLGQYLAILGLFSFFSGLMMLYIYTKTFFTYTLHYIFGFTLAILISITYLISKKITADSSGFRKAHFITGAAIILLYITQTITGIKKLLAYF